MNLSLRAFRKILLVFIACLFIFAYALSSGSFDFLKGMIPHHQGAIDMSEELIKKTKDPELKAFAEKIIKDQKAEIKQMQDWLKKRDKK